MKIVVVSTKERQELIKAYVLPFLDAPVASAEISWIELPDGGSADLDVLKVALPVQIDGLILVGADPEQLMKNYLVLGAALDSIPVEAVVVSADASSDEFCPLMEMVTADMA